MTPRITGPRSLDTPMKNSRNSKRQKKTVLPVHKPSSSKDHSPPMHCRSPIGEYDLAGQNDSRTTTDSTRATYGSSAPSQLALSFDQTEQQPTLTLINDIVAQDLFELPQQRIDYPGYGGSMGPHALSPNSVVEAKAAAEAMERARGGCSCTLNGSPANRSDSYQSSS